MSQSSTTPSAISDISHSEDLGPIIAVDLDDVLSQTNINVAEWHNRIYGTKMTLADFHYYHYWKNPYWGDIAKTVDKVRDYYASGSLYSAELVDGALEGTQKLKSLGFRLVVVTARYNTQLDNSWTWLEKYFAGLFETIVCIGQEKETVEAGGHELITKLSKAEVCQQIRAVLIIDDSLDNALECASFSNPTPVILFGDYEWNKRPSKVISEKDKMGFDERIKVEDGKEWWQEETATIPDGAPIWRADNWDDVIKHVENMKQTK